MINGKRFNGLMCLVSVHRCIVPKDVGLTYGCLTPKNVGHRRHGLPLEDFIAFSASVNHFEFRANRTIKRGWILWLMDGAC